MDLTQYHPLSSLWLNCSTVNGQEEEKNRIGKKAEIQAFSLVHTMNEEFGLIMTTSEEKNLGVTFLV